MPGTDLIDVRATAELRRKQRRSRVLKLLLPLACVLIMVTVIIGIAAYSYTSNRRDAAALASELVRSTELRIAAEVKRYLSPASEMIKLACGIFEKTETVDDEEEVLETLGLQFLSIFPQFFSFNAGDTDGNFLMTQKGPDGAIHTKHIDREVAPRKVTWTRRSLEGKVIAEETDEQDRYDPRKRPWYTGAVQTRGIHWTDVYLFFTSRKPGVTASMAVYDQSEALVGVLSVDILLEDLIRFLTDLRIGQTGRALIIDEQGRLIAYPDLDRMIRDGSEVPAPVKLDELNDPVLTRTYDRFRIEGLGTRYINVDGQRYSTTASSLQSVVGRNWTILLTVAEDDFVGFVRRNVGRSLLFSLIVLALAALLAVLLMRQSLKTERTSRLLNERQQQMEAQSRAFSELTSTVSLFDADDTDSLAHLTATVANALGIRRVSVWRMTGDGKRLVCEDSYDRESHRHAREAELERDDFSALFDALSMGEEIVATHTAKDQRTLELSRAYLAPMGCGALLAVPVKERNQVAGSVWFEHDGQARGWSMEDANFARSIADLLALRLMAVRQMRAAAMPVADPGASADSRSLADGDQGEAVCVSDGIAGSLPSPATMRTTLLRSERMKALQRKLGARQADGQALALDVLDGIAVMVIRFTNPLSMAEPVPNDGARSVFEHLVCHIEQVAEANRIEYVKMMDAQIVFATGFEGGLNRAAPRIAQAALQIQDLCMHVFADIDAMMEYRIGIDMGTAIGTFVGCNHDVYNLWGDAMHTATVMAETGLNGAIHVTEATFTCLGADYFIRRRGAFYVEHQGEIRTYLLTGRR